MKLKEAELHLPIYRQGDDLDQYLEQEGGDSHKALDLYAGDLDTAKEMCRRLQQEMVGVRGARIAEAQTHLITVLGPADWIDRLVAEGLLYDPAQDQALVRVTTKHVHEDTDD
jgi:hypothetical protein